MGRDGTGLWVNQGETGRKHVKTEKKIKRKKVEEEKGKAKVTIPPLNDTNTNTQE